jgi:hypothetical protein
VLSDPDSRAYYDQHGQVGCTPHRCTALFDWRVCAAVGSEGGMRDSLLDWSDGLVTLKPWSHTHAYDHSPLFPRLLCCMPGTCTLSSLFQHPAILLLTCLPFDTPAHCRRPPPWFSFVQWAGLDKFPWAGNCGVQHVPKVPVRHVHPVPHGRVLLQIHTRVEAKGNRCDCLLVFSW